MSARQSAQSRRLQRLLHRAECLTRKGNTPAAERCFRKAIAEETSIHARVPFGRFLSRQGRLQEAFVVLDKAWQLSLCDGDDACRALCSRELSILCRLSGRRACASQFRHLALRAELRLQGGPSGVSLWLAAGEALDRGCCDDAERLLAASINGTPAPRRADVLAERGRLCRTGGDRSQAIVCLRRSAGLLLREHDTFTAARVLEALGQMFVDDQRYRAAMKAFRRSAGLFLRIDRREDARRVLSSIREADRRGRLLRAVAERN